MSPGNLASLNPAEDNVAGQSRTHLTVLKHEGLREGYVTTLDRGEDGAVEAWWQQHAKGLGSDPWPEERVDDVVVGAGLTGLTTALLLARSGRRVCVLEAREAGAVTTGRTTGKLSLLQGTKLSKLLARHGRATTARYVDGNREGQQWLLRFCSDHGVPTQTRDAVTYAAAPVDVRAVLDEYDATRELGLPTRWVDSLDVPFTNHGGVLLPEQAQFDPMDVLAALAEQLRAHGGSLHEGQRVVGVSGRSGRSVTLTDGRELRADTVVVATGTSFLDRSLHFARVTPRRSYLAAFTGVAAPPEGMYLSAGQPSHSVRDLPHPDGPILLTGGYGHDVGRVRSERQHLDRLREWTLRFFPDAVEVSAWSAQDYSPADLLPYVGRTALAGASTYFATGFDKWGLANAVAAARQVSGEILGERPSWAWTDHAPALGDAGSLAKANARVGFELAKGYAKAVPERRLGPLCTHLGGRLKWNDAERSWDCPLHGSRFAADGSVLEGPATCPLKGAAEFGEPGEGNSPKTNSEGEHRA